MPRPNVGRRAARHHVGATQPWVVASPTVMPRPNVGRRAASPSCGCDPTLGRHVAPGDPATQPWVVTSPLVIPRPNVGRPRPDMPSAPCGEGPAHSRRAMTSAGVTGARMAGDDARALELFQRAEKQEPDSARVRVHLAATYQALGEWE